MPSNNEYKRYFIILQEDDKGYELAAGKIPTGYAKIEIKNGRGKMTAYAQNVRNGDKTNYRMLLVAPNKRAAVDMGRIMVDATGRGELNVEFDADNVMKTGINISDFFVAAVSSETGIPLSGYTGRDKMQWKGQYNIINKTYDRIDKKIQPVQEVVTPVQMQPMQQMPTMPEMPNLNLGQIVEGAKSVIGNVVEGATGVVEEVVGDVVQGAKNVIGNVVEGAKDVAGEIYEGAVNVVEDVVGDVVQGAKNLVGGVMENEAVPMTHIPSTQAPMAPMTPIQAPMQSVPKQAVKGSVGGQKKGAKEVVEEVMPEAIMPTPIQPAPVQVPIQPEVMPAETQPVEVPIQPEVKPAQVQPVEIPIQPEVKVTPVQPVEIPIVVKPIIEAPPVQPIIMAPKKPIYEAETEVKAKFIIETETEPVHYEHMHHEPCDIECENIEYKDYYYDEESERDSDSDSDSDDREREKHHEHHEKEHEHEHEHEHEDSMRRRLMKVLGKLRRYEPFENEAGREEWFKIEDDIYLLNNAVIPFMGSMMPLGYPYIMNDCVMMIGKKDYIIGVKYDRDREKRHPRYIMFGMPGRYNKQEEAYYRMRGFNRFRPHRSRSYGYWIMAVDLSTGRIISK